MYSYVNRLARRRPLRAITGDVSPSTLLTEQVRHRIRRRPRLRYSGTSVGYQLASIIAGGPSPIVSTWLFATYHSSIPIAIYILVIAIIGIIATSLLTDYTGKDISAEYAGV